MKTEDSAHNRETDIDASTDAEIRRFYQEHSAHVDVHGFVSELGARLRTTTKRTQQRPLARRVCLALAGLIVAGGLGVGVWQAVEYLAAPRETLLIGDIGEPSLGDDLDSGGTSTTWMVAPALDGVGGSVPSGMESWVPPFTSEEPRSLDQLRLSDVWAEAAAALAVNPGTARLASVQVSWGSDGLLASFYVTAVTPDARVIDLSAFLGGPDIDETSDHVTFTGSVQSQLASGYPGWSDQTNSVFVSVGELLTRLDDAGLMEIAAQSGVEVAGDASDLWADYVRSHPVESDATSGIFWPDEPPDRVTWQLSQSVWPSVLLTAGDLTSFSGPAGSNPVVLGISGGRVAPVDGAQLPSSLLPAFGLGLGREWSSTSPSGGSSYSSGGEGEVFVLLGPWETEPADSVTSHVPDIRLDGLAFTTPSDWTYSEGTVRCFRDGAAETIWEPDTLFGPGFGSYGVSYSLGGTRLLCAGGIWLVTRDGSEVSVEVIGGVSSGGSMSSGGDETGSWSATGSGEAAVIELSPTERSESQELLRCDGLLWMNRVAYDESNNRIWLARQANGLGDVNLWTAQPHASELVPVPLADSFGGDFAVSPDGSTIVYVGTWQVPAKVIMRTPDSETDLALGLATAYSPVFSPEGDKVCLVGSQALDGETAIWIFDADGGNCREIASTRGLAPTFPVFSPDGQRIAFRSWKLGDIWTVVVDRGELTRYAINAADAPIAW